MIRSTPHPPRDVETSTAALIQAVLPQVQIQQHDPGGGPVQTYDFDLVYDNGAVEALEVTEATDKSLRGLTAGFAWSATTDPKRIVALPSNLDEWVEQPNDPGRHLLVGSHGKPLLWRARLPACCSSRGDGGWTSTRTT